MFKFKVINLPKSKFWGHLSLIASFTNTLGLNRETFEGVFAMSASTSKFLGSMTETGD